MVKIKKIHDNKLNESVDKIIQYYSNESLINEIKNVLSEDNYLKFLKQNIPDNLQNESIESVIIDNFTGNEIITKLHNFSSKAFDELKNNLINNIIE